jgi:hypothetical protein
MLVMDGVVVLEKELIPRAPPVLEKEPPKAR